MKRCNTCNTLHPLSYFHRDPKSLDGRNRKCKSCRSSHHQMKKYGAVGGPECEICGAMENLGVDHCHDSSKVRGTLCRQCNSGIGFLGDTVSGVLRALNYLLKEEK